MAVNPYDLTSPSPNATMANNAANMSADVNPAQTNGTALASNNNATSTDANAVSPVNYSGPSAATYNASTTNANTYTANQGKVNNWNVDNNQTVQGQIAGIIASNSPLMQLSKNQALEQMNARGLLNSSMAIGAGQNAVYQSALPIAQADANMFGQAGKYNADVANNMSQFNATAANQAGQFNANSANQINLANQGAQNQAAQFNAQNITQTGLANAQNDTQAREFNATTQADINKTNAQLRTNTALANAQNANQTSQFNAQTLNQASEANAGRQQQASMANAASANDLMKQQLDNAFKTTIASGDNQTKADMSALQAQTQKDVAGIEAQYKQLMQTSTSASEAYQQAVKNITDIVGNKDIVDPTTAINNQMIYLRNAMSVLDQLNTNVSGLADLF